MRANGGPGARQQGAGLALGVMLVATFGLGSFAGASFARMDTLRAGCADKILHDGLRSQDEEKRATAAALAYERMRTTLGVMREQSHDTTVAAHLEQIESLIR